MLINNAATKYQSNGQVELWSVHNEVDFFFFFPQSGRMGGMGSGPKKFDKYQNKRLEFFLKKILFFLDIFIKGDIFVI